MCKTPFLASFVFMASITMEQNAMAQEPEAAGNYGSLISAAVVVSFPYGSYTFLPTAEQAVMLAGAKKATLVMIRGRTSTTTPIARDEALALARALSARTYLVRCGVSPLNIAVSFASGTDFVADNSTQAGRRQNQRVEVELIYVSPSAEINSNASLR